MAHARKACGPLVWLIGAIFLAIPLPPFLASVAHSGKSGVEAAGVEGNLLYKPVSPCAAQAALPAVDFTGAEPFQTITVPPCSNITLRFPFGIGVPEVARLGDRTSVRLDMEKKQIELEIAVPEFEGAATILLNSRPIGRLVSGRPQLTPRWMLGAGPGRIAAWSLLSGALAVLLGWGIRRFLWARPGGETEADVGGRISLKLPPLGPLTIVATIGAAAQVVGLSWDIATHIDRGRETFWSPPHLLLYSGVLLILITALSALWTLRKERGPWSARLRRYPTVTFVALATLFQLTSAPFDELWHRTFGPDVGVWSPPHFVLIWGMGLSILAVATHELVLRRQTGVLDQVPPVSRFVLPALFVAFALCGFLITVAESEFVNIPGDHYSQLRRAEVYHVLLIGLTLPVLAFLRALWRRPGFLPLCVLLYTLVRSLITFAWYTIGWSHMILPALLLPAAVCYDLAPSRRDPHTTWPAALAFAGGYFVVAYPWGLWSGLNDPAGVYLRALLPALGIALVGAAVGSRFGGRLADALVREPMRPARESATRVGVR